ncbi:MAG: nuclear transport factor 2 family protein [Pseudomonadota bacterium]
MTPAETLRAFWASMATNDFAAAALLLAPEIEVHWPQSGEVIRGRADFAALNAAYPTTGLWRFRIDRMVAEGAEVVTDVLVQNDVMNARAITFSTVTDGRIARQVEYWPDPFPAPEWRAAWVSRS